MPKRFVKRLTPLKWSIWTLAQNDFPNQRFQRRFRYRVVGYLAPELQQMYSLDIKSVPIYEIQEHVQTTFLNPGRRPVIESSYKVSFIHETMISRAERICLNCLHKSMNNQCFSCNTNDQKYIFKFEEIDSTEQGFQSEYFYTKSGYFPDNRFPHQLKEELMMKTFHPDRKNLFHWIFDLEELATTPLED